MFNVSGAAIQSFDGGTLETARSLSLPVLWSLGQFRPAAAYMDGILEGEKSAELPVPK
jgi:hypothetical protein